MDLLKALRLPPTPTIVHNEEWDWLFAPHPEEHPRHDYIHTVSGKIYERTVADKDLDEAQNKEDGLAVDVQAPSLKAPVGDIIGRTVPER